MNNLSDLLTPSAHETFAGHVLRGERDLALAALFGGMSTVDKEAWDNDDETPNEFVVRLVGWALGQGMSACRPVADLRDQFTNALFNSTFADVLQEKRLDAAALMLLCNARGSISGAEALAMVADAHEELNPPDVTLEEIRLGDVIYTINSGAYRDNAFVNDREGEEYLFRYRDRIFTATAYQGKHYEAPQVHAERLSIGLDEVEQVWRIVRKHRKGA